MEELAFPAIRAALAYSRSSAVVNIYSDVNALPRDEGGQVYVRPHVISPMQRTHDTLGMVHRRAIDELAQWQLPISFINADMVVSVEAFAFAERQIVLGKRLVLAAATRTMAKESPPSGAMSRDLLAWAWKNRHPWVTECIWGSGRSRCPAVINFVRGDDVVAHAFHLHPFAVVLGDGRINFKGTTVDYDLVSQFKVDQICVATSPDDMAFAEVSPLEPERWINYPQPMTVQDVVRWANAPLPGASRMPQTSHAHHVLFNQRIVLRGSGDGDFEDNRVVPYILSEIGSHRGAH